MKNFTDTLGGILATLVLMLCYHCYKESKYEITEHIQYSETTYTTRIKLLD
jgi:hypothetical protein